MPSRLQIQRLSRNTTPTVSYNKTRIVPLSCASPVPETVTRHHAHRILPNQCCSSVVQTINAPLAAVWSVLRRFDNPQAYKRFLKSCRLIFGDGNVGSLREVHVISGMPANSSMERLDIIDDECHVIGFSVVGGDHRLTNYKSVTSLHLSPSGNETVVVESYIVDIPTGNTKEDTCMFVDTIVRCNLESLKHIAENDLAKDHGNIITINKKNFS